MTTAIGQHLGHYQILSLLGVGGMGEVYLAQDTKLERKVALKVLPAVQADNEEARKRLLREARAAARLDHPNICAIYEVGEANGHSFIAMQYVEGETLAARLRQQRLSCAEALSIARQVADALAEAHQHNVVHRDIKPANIMLTSRGQVKVLDFGLAKTVEGDWVGTESAETQSMLTQSGTIVGTVPYMSPEQVRGEQVDKRSDIFSFGVVLYEMLSGRRAFAHNSAAEIIAAILYKEPVELSSDSAIGVSKEVEEIVRRCLVKDKEQRYQTMQEVSTDLSRVSSVETLPAEESRRTAPIEAPATNQHRLRLPVTLTAAFAVLLLLALSYGLYRSMALKPTEEIDSIAVLPLVNSNRDQNMEYLSDGITESVISNLSQLPKLKVTPRNSVFRYKGQEPDAQKIAQDLGVRAVMVGNFKQVGDQIIVYVELIDTAKNKVIWSHQYPHKITDIITTQNEIAQDTVGNLRLKLSSPEQQQLNRRPTESDEAYDLYLKGRHLGDKLDPAQLNESINYYRQAIDKDHNFAQAYSGLALDYVVLGIHFSPPRENMPIAKDYANQALRIDKDLTDPHAVLGIVALLYDWDWDKAKQELAIGGAVNPQNLETFACTAHVLQSTGRAREAGQTLLQALVHDPLSVGLKTELGCNSYYAGQFDDSIKEYREALKLDSRNMVAYFGLGRTYDKQERYQEALQELSHVQALYGFAPPLIVSETGYAYGKLGKHEEAQKAIRQLNEQAKQSYVDPYFVAVVYLGLGDKNQALAWLEKAYEVKSSLIPAIIREPKWDEVRNEARFTDILHHLKLI